MLDSTPATLYRLFAADGDLLYVGIAANLGRRFEQHAEQKPWWSEVVHIRLEHHASRLAALTAETRAIRDEYPRHNVVHNTGDEVVFGVFPPLPGTLTFRCDGCREPIKGGYLKLNGADLDARQAAKREWVAIYGGQPSVSISDLTMHPKPVRWRFWHEGCDPDPDGRAAYTIDLQRLRTMTDVVWWTAHLLRKSWLGDTAWGDLLRELHSQATPGAT